MYKACIFDLDGTLANTLKTLAYVGNTALEKCGFLPVSEEIYPSLIGNGADVLIQKLIKMSSGNEANECILKHVRRKYDKIYAANPLHLTSAYDGICDMLNELSSLKIKTAVLSNKPHDMTCEVVKGIFSNHKFDVVFGQREGVAKKPSPEAPLEIASLLNIAPEEFLFIGDSGVDMKTASAAGMTSVGVTWGFRSKEELMDNGASHLISSARELLSLL